MNYPVVAESRLFITDAFNTPLVSRAGAPELPKATKWKEMRAVHPCKLRGSSLEASGVQAERKFTFQVIGWHIKTFILFGQINEQFN